ncbi:hypothetical protein [Niabella hibiscisoli]|uniref:hypothetical protein n=1 Tax=Niabella hibiscisoli TaxID=1825928 RepID=UPI001F0E5307|nr:hypothetical protein [Niabella hibiscisoli]MCH5719025.1 hypothetical protein [Niabella hibiscisoli]
MQTLPVIDIVVILVYLVAMIYVGYFFPGKIKARTSLPKHPGIFQGGPSGFRSTLLS